MEEQHIDINALKANARRGFSKMNESDKQIVTKIIQFDLIKELTRNMKNYKHATKEQWQKTIIKLKNYNKLFDLKGDTFGKFIETLLPLLGAYLGALFTFKQNEKNTIESALPEYKLTEESEFTSDTSAILAHMAKVVGIDMTKPSKIVEYCNKEKYNFSFAYKPVDQNANGNTQDSSDCIISFCPPEETSDTSSLIDLATVNTSKGLIVEYDRNYPHACTVNEGDVLTFTDILGDINGVPVKSHIWGIVSKKTNDYFIADYIGEMPELDVDSLIEQYQNKELENINELFTNNMHVVNFIKDYILELRIPSIANHLREHVFANVDEVSASKYLKKYRKKGKKIVEDFEKRTKKNCSAKNVESYGRASKLFELKDILDKDRKSTFNEILDLYHNYKDLGYCSKGRIADYMLYDEYMDYLTDEERFRYDDSNPYVVKMFKLICKFIGTRSQLEKNLENIPSLISKFNRECKKAIKKYWKPNSNDYYTEMKNIFRYEYYTNDTEQLIEAIATDKDAVSMYSKVFDYLKALTHYVRPEAEEITYSEDIDVKAILKSNKTSEIDTEFENDLKKIAFNFCLIRNIETSAEDDSIFNTIANNAIVTAFYYLHLLTGALIEEYDEEYTGIDPIVLVNRAILRPYLKTLKKVTQSEIYELDKLGKEALQWYESNSEKVNDPHIFDSFKEISWGGESTVYYKNEQYDYTYLQYQETELDKLKSLGNEPFDFDTPVENDDYYDSGAYIKSASGPNSYLYWLRYLTIATVVNCMLPIYWGTGIIIAGAPIILPIIMLPIFVLPGRVTVVFGIGLCGICPMPLILFCNMGNTKASVLIPLNILADTLKNALKSITNAQKPVLEAAYAPVTKLMDTNINRYNTELDNIEQQIHNVENYVKTNKSILRNIKRRNKEDPTDLAIK
jgi:hypothetical protein